MALKRRHKRLLLIAGLLGIGLVIAVWEPVPLEQLLAWGERLASYPATLIALILLQITMYTFALPGSVVLWMVAPFYPPWLATLILLVGSLSGAAGARRFSMRLKRPSERGEETSTVIRLLHRRADFFTQCSLRALPGFPHSLINYAAGILHLPLATFMLAALVGLGIKWGVYTTAIHGAAEAAEGEAALDPATLGALALLAVLMLGGAWLRRRIEKREGGKPDQNH